MHECQPDPLVLHWLAGLLEGEGYFYRDSNGPAITLSMTDQDVVERVAVLWGVAAFPLKPTKSHYKTPYVARIKGGRAVDWMRWAYPILGTRRRAQIDIACEGYAPKSRQLLHPHQIEAVISAVRNQGERVSLVAQRFGIQREFVYKLLRERRG